jgi:putative ABC transport system permease protein
VGAAAGVVAAVAAGPAAQELLFETSARDLSVMAVAMVTLLVVAFAAAMVPAWRAARVSPMVALRVE